MTPHQAVVEINAALASGLEPGEIMHLRCGANICRWRADKRRCLGQHLYNVSFPGISLKRAKEIKAAARLSPPTVAGEKLRFSANKIADGRPHVFYCFLSLRSINGPRFIPEDA